MTKKTKFRVVREHYADRPYVTGDERIAVASDVAHLVPHVLEPIEEVDDADEDEGEKAEPAPANKAEAAAPRNKAPSRHKTKGK